MAQLRMKKIYAALNDIENNTAAVIYRNEGEGNWCWYVFTTVVDVDTAVKIADALNRAQQAVKTDG